MRAIRSVMGSVAALCVVCALTDVFADGGRGSSMEVPVAFLPVTGRMPALDGAVAWQNSAPLGLSNLRNKVVVVQFWTYSCINWQRTLPHVRAWAEKYRDHPVVVIGVHTPEFGFEKDLGNIRDASAQLGVAYPVVVDSNYAIWRAFGNSAWPALYIVDAHGKIRYRHDGEGDYDQAERVIQKLLAQAGEKGVPTGLAPVEGTGSQAEADWANLRSPENYVGSERTANFLSPGGLKPGPWNYVAPNQLRLNSWALTGDWAVGPEAAVSAKAHGRILYRFHARDLNLVMGPSARGKPVPFRILIDGKPPGAAHGTDVDAEGAGTLVEHRLYQLVRQDSPIVDRQFEIEFLAPGAEAFSFTFG